MTACPNGHENPTAQRFCGTCGALLHEPSPHASDLIAAAPPRRPRRLLAVAAVIALLLAAGVAVYLTQRGPDRTIQARFTLIDEDVTGDAEDCEGSGGYDDVEAGMPVTVRDEDGKIVGSSMTRNGTKDEIRERTLAENEATPPDADDDSTDSPLDTGKINDVFLDLPNVCVLLVEVGVFDVDFYEVEVGRRGKISYSKSELRKRDWHVAVGLD